MAKKTIYIPPELAAQMARENMNWSALAQAAWKLAIREKHLVREDRLGELDRFFYKRPDLDDFVAANPSAAAPMKAAFLGGATWMADRIRGLAEGEEWNKGREGKCHP